MEDLVLKNITDYNLIEKGQIIGVGFSGGSDSVVLLHCLTVLSKKIGFKIVAIHINHGIRGQEAERDQAFAEEFCKKYGIEITPETVLTHYEFGKSHPKTTSAGKIDIIFLPPFSWVEPQEVGKFIRTKVKWYLQREK